MMSRHQTASTGARAAEAELHQWCHGFCLETLQSALGRDAIERGDPVFDTRFNCRMNGAVMDEDLEKEDAALPLVVDQARQRSRHVCRYVAAVKVLSHHRHRCNRVSCVDSLVGVL